MVIVLRFLIKIFIKIKIYFDSDEADAEFVQVSIGFAVLSAMSIYMPLYTLFKLKPEIDSKSEDNAESLEERVIQTEL